MERCQRSRRPPCRNLASWLKNIQIMAQSVDSHLANAQVFMYTARGIQEMATRLKVSHKGRLRQRTIDMADHLVTSMEKQHMWFLNYRGRKDVVMNMIFHFNTQEDALNSIELAADMKRDSTSMTSIALLTMMFLPGTFIAVRFPSSPLETATSLTDARNRVCLVRASSSPHPAWPRSKSRGFGGYGLSLLCLSHSSLSCAGTGGSSGRSARTRKDRSCPSRQREATMLRVGLGGGLRWRPF
jgi:hypothetical protein